MEVAKRRLDKADHTRAVLLVMGGAPCSRVARELGTDPDLIVKWATGASRAYAREWAHEIASGRVNFLRIAY